MENYSTVRYFNQVLNLIVLFLSSTCQFQNQYLPAALGRNWGGDLTTLLQYKTWQKYSREFSWEISIGDMIFESFSYLFLARDGHGGVDWVHALAQTVVVHVEAVEAALRLWGGDKVARGELTDHCELRCSGGDSDVVTEPWWPLTYVSRVLVLALHRSLSVSGGAAFYRVPSVPREGSLRCGEEWGVLVRCVQVGWP